MWNNGKLELIAPCHFGLEAVLKREITREGWEILEVEDGRVIFAGDARTVCDANIRLRTAERILIRLGAFRAESFDELFEETRRLPLDAFLPPDARFWVTKASSVRSRLFSPSDIQSVMKKAMVEGMRDRTGAASFPEDGPAYPIRVTIRNNIVTAALDTTGDALHKRGYRVQPVLAPISETLAAAILELSPWRPGRLLVDPFCGSGTIPIEAAMRVKGIAPGLKRRFLSEKWTTVVTPGDFRRARREAEERIVREPLAEIRIQGYDIDGRAVRAARANAEAAGVADLIHFQRRPVSELNSPGSYGFIVTNPPYGERIGEAEGLEALYREIGEAYGRLDSWSMYLITSYREAEKAIGRRADRNRKIYNGMLQTYLYQYMGPKPAGRGEKR